MISNRKAIGVAFLCVAALNISAGVADAGAMSKAMRQVFRATNTAETGVGICNAKREGKQLLDCVSGEMNKMGSRLEVKGADKLAPRGAPAAKSAASAISASASPAAAVSVLNRARSEMAALAASSYGETQRAYSAIGTAFERAISALGKKS